MKRNIEDILGYKFQNISLLQEALNHPSLNTTKWKKISTYQRLEFLGDAVIQLVLSHYVYTLTPQYSEGDLSLMMSNLVNGKVSARIAKDIHLGQYIAMSASEENDLGREKDSNLEDALEAVIGAIYLDGGLEEVRKVVQNLWKKMIDTESIHSLIKKNEKTELQEILQEMKIELPQYKCINIEKMDGEEVFIIEVSAGKWKCKGKGKSKREGERRAAKEMLNLIAKKKQGIDI
ncbi:Ribonuclease 3 [Candidatus Fokinia solitaria]|uniref:Ribonuclease 3 n=1 Tax=Candidatus Fokinia solitaria TaxID=1802984 RepID=A0A2U8BSY5_9RICK|nr:ribonuclease III [Candidatus Fokinia solitaria]AWD33461.1 Ribonuclease 3 [Candidatus Fokinia solitaria]